MSTPELHADDLLDREIRGLLTADERTRLEAHLAVCSVCRFERAVRADFRAEFSAPEPAAESDERAGSGLRVFPARGRFVRRARVRLFGLVAVALLLAGVATAELSGKGLFSYLVQVPERAQAPVAPASALERPPRPPRRGPLAASGSAPAPAATAPEPSAAPAEAQVEVPPAPAIPSSAPHVAAPQPTAAELFDQARDARERGDYAYAVDCYRRLLKAYPASPQASTGHALLGRLLLDRSDPGAALAQFDAYLASGATTLAEEALLGRALAFGKLGQAVPEAAAWQALLSAYPGSLHAPRARERLSALAAQ